MEYQGQNSAFSTILCPKDMNRTCFVIEVSLWIFEFSSTVVAYTFMFNCKTETTALDSSSSYYIRKSVSISSLNYHTEKLESSDFFACCDQGYKKKSLSIC